MLPVFRQRVTARAKESVQYRLPTMRRRAYSALLGNPSLRELRRGITTTTSSTSSSGIGFVDGVYDNVNIGSPSTPNDRQHHHHHQRQRQLRHSRPPSCMPRGAWLQIHPGSSSSSGGSSSASHPPSCVIRQQFSSRSKNKGGGRGGGGGKKRAAGDAGAGAGASASTETTETVITLDRVAKQLPGGRQLFAEASLSFVRGAKVGVLGVNGSGKSTVLKIIAGEGQCCFTSRYHAMHPRILTNHTTAALCSVSACLLLCT